MSVVDTRPIARSEVEVVFHGAPEGSLEPFETRQVFRCRTTQEAHGGEIVAFDDDALPVEIPRPYEDRDAGCDEFQRVDVAQCGCVDVWWP